jgi:hypothetical protein
MRNVHNADEALAGNESVGNIAPASSTSAIFSLKNRIALRVRSLDLADLLTAFHVAIRVVEKRWPCSDAAIQAAPRRVPEEVAVS